jgi:subtilase family serine protease
MKKHFTRLNVEHLEVREVLSVAYTPAQIQHAYGFDQMGLDGSGQTIAIVDAYDHPSIASNLHTFDQQFGLPDPPSFIKVNQYGGSTMPQVNAGWAGEIALDVEWAHAIAPMANILLVEANSNSNNDLYTAVDFARHQPGVVVVSMSFGGGEFSGQQNLDALFTTPAGHIGGSGLAGGVTFVASTGDNAAPAGYPSYSPNVVGVGGTSLYLDQAGNWVDEQGWSHGGGGISQVEAEPAYQYSVQSTGRRTAPDVSYDADPNTGFWVYNTVGGNGWGVIGGTSAGAPQWSALIALTDQWRAQAYGVGSLDGPGQTLPALYSQQMSQDFIDITVGYNGYYAGPGYDLVTGLGSPWAPYVVSDLAYAGLGGGASPASAASAAFGSAARQEATLHFLVSDRLPANAGLGSALDVVFSASNLAGTAQQAGLPAAELAGLAPSDKLAAMVRSLVNHARPHDLWQLDQPGFLDLGAANLGFAVLS